MKRSLGLDLLRILMAAMVVGLHTNWLCQASPLWNQLTVNGLFRIAVPVFFLINGYYAFDAFEGARTRSWLRRILQIYCFWAVAYLPAYLPHANASGSELRGFLASVVFGYWHLWYMVALALGGALLWLLRSRPSRELLCLAAALFAVAVALEFAKMRGLGQIPVKLYRNFLLDALPFLLMGYVARRDGIEGSRPTLWIVFILGLAGLAIESIVESRIASPSVEPDLFVSLFVLCPAIFLLVRKLPFKAASDRWAKASSAIYFSHVGFVLLGEHLAIAPGMELFLFALVLSALASWPLVAVSRRLRFVL